MIAKEDIFITQNGKTIAKVVKPQASAADSLRGMLKDAPADIDLDSLREERQTAKRGYAVIIKDIQRTFKMK